MKRFFIGWYSKDKQIYIVATKQKRKKWKIFSENKKKIKIITMDPIVFVTVLFVHKATYEVIEVYANQFLNFELILWCPFAPVKQKEKFFCCFTGTNQLFSKDAIFFGAVNNKFLKKYILIFLINRTCLDFRTLNSQRILLVKKWKNYRNSNFGKTLCCE